MRVRGKPAGLVVVAALLAAALVGLSLVALLSSGGAPERSADLGPTFSDVDAAYQRATQDFLDKAKDAKGTELAATIELLTDVKQAVTRARLALDRLDSVPETDRPLERLGKSLRVEELALDEAIAAARNQDASGVTAASEKYQTAVLAYQVAKAQMQTALDTCGDRCR